MKIGVVTWFHYQNYGTVLQAVALQKYIKNQNHEVYLINYIPIENKHKTKASLKEKIDNKINQIILKQAYKKWKNEFENKSKSFHETIKNNCQLTHLVQSIDELKEISNNFDILICGSDQIWNPRWLNPIYYLNFANKQTKIAYAPSFGVSRLNNDIKNDIKILLNKLDYISIRENEGANIVKDLIGIKPQIVVDPTFLLTKEDWNNMIKHVEYHNKYVLCYFLSENFNHWQAIKNFILINKYELIIIPISGFSYFKKGDVRKNVSPEEFLSLIKNAEYIFTDSFHGTVLSIIFQRQFFAFERFKNNTYYSQNSRINNLLNLLELKDRLLPYNCKKINQMPQINYTRANQLLNIQIKQSKDFLNNALKFKIKEVEYERI